MCVCERDRDNFEDSPILLLIQDNSKTVGVGRFDYV